MENIILTKVTELNNDTIKVQGFFAEDKAQLDAARKALADLTLVAPKMDDKENVLNQAAIDAYHKNKHDLEFTINALLRRELIAYGWTSAMMNYFDTHQYDANGHIKAGESGRRMIDEEKHAYWISLLKETVPHFVTREQKKVLFENT